MLQIIQNVFWLVFKYFKLWPVFEIMVNGIHRGKSLFFFPNIVVCSRSNSCYVQWWSAVSGYIAMHEIIGKERTW